MISVIPNNSKQKWLFENLAHQPAIRKMVEVYIKPQTWQHLDSYIVVPLSIHSAIYQGNNADYKIKGYLNTIKAYGERKILILLSEGAHLNALSLKYNHCIDTAYKICKQDADHFSNVLKMILTAAKLHFGMTLFGNIKIIPTSNLNF